MIMDLEFHVNERVESTEALDLMKRSERKRPTEDAHRLVRIVPRANIVVTVRDGQKLVGLARGLKECSGCCYLSDLLVDPAYQAQALGEQLIRHVRQAIGDNTLIMLLPAPDAMAYSTEID
jgi:ribosomal protein S18 acetylase RimI-like enzyme